MSWDSDPPNGFDRPVSFDTGDSLGAPIVTPELTSAPLQWLYAGIAVSVVGFAVPFLTDSTPLAVVGWLLGGTFSILLLAVFIQRDTARRATGWATAGERTGVLRIALLVAAAAAVVVNAWAIADAAGRHQW